MVVIGDRSVVPDDRLLTELAYQIAEASPAIVRVRARSSSEISTETEKAVAELVERMRANGFQVHVERVVPDGNARRYNWLRDYELVRGSDRVIACFSSDDFHTGGTGHALWAAISCGIHSQAWAVKQDGSPTIFEYNQEDCHEVHGNPLGY